MQQDVQINGGFDGALMFFIVVPLHLLAEIEYQLLPAAV